MTDIQREGLWRWWLRIYFGILAVALSSWVVIVAWQARHPSPPVVVAASERAPVPLHRDVHIAATVAGQNLVWLNTRSGIYHYPGYRWFGTTQRGQFMLEQTAVRHGRAALNERRPITVTSPEYYEFSSPER